METAVNNLLLLWGFCFGIMLGKLIFLYLKEKIDIVFTQLTKLYTPQFKYNRKQKTWYYLGVGKGE